MKKTNTLAYLEQLRKRYRGYSSKEKKVIMNEFVKTTGYDRQHAGKLLRGNYHYTTKPIKRPRKRRYDMLDAIVLAKVCTLLDWINSKRIQSQIGVAIDSLVTAGELRCTKEQRKKVTTQVSYGLVEELKNV